MAALSADQVRNFVRVTQDRYRVIDHDDWDGQRYRTADSTKWQQAAHDSVPRAYQEWREIVRVLAQGESYYGGRY